jgi:microcystin-dependent protein
MSNPFIGEIRMFGGSFAPAGWAFCAGQLMPISENDALFTLIGTTYGGDGQETFALPDLQGRLPLHQGQAPKGSQNYQLGEKAGVESVTLTVQQIPTHTHAFMASTALALSPDPTGNIVAQPPTINLFFGDVAAAGLNQQSIQPTGGSQPHENCQPFLCISFIISLFGVFPPQS